MGRVRILGVCFTNNHGVDMGKGYLTHGDINKELEEGGCGKGDGLATVFFGVSGPGASTPVPRIKFDNSYPIIEG